MKYVPIDMVIIINTRKCKFECTEIYYLIVYKLKKKIRV